MPEKLLIDLGQSPPESPKVVRERAAGLHFRGLSKPDAGQVLHFHLRSLNPL